MSRPSKGAGATELANFLLALPQRKPCDVGMFTSKLSNGTAALYPEGPPLVQAVRPVIADESKVRAELAAFLRTHFAGSPAQVAKTLALFDRADVKQKIPDPTLRAALVCLRGTVAEPVIEWFLREDVSRTSVRFGGTPLGFIATVFGSPGSRTMLFNRGYAGEHFALLSAMFAHEILHHDAIVIPAEEVLLHAVDASVHMQLLARHPTLASGRTELARMMNDEVLRWVNSRLPGSATPSIVAPGGKGTVPGSARSQRDLWSHSTEFTFIPRSGLPDVSPAPEVYAVVVRKLLAPGVAIPKPLAYGRQTAELFSRMNDTWLSPVDQLRISVLLGLVSVDEIVKYAGLPRAQAISMFRLTPILAAMN